MDINIPKKYIKISIVFLVVVVLVFPVYYVGNKLSYKYRVDESYAEKIKKDLQLVSGFFGDNMLSYNDWQHDNDSAISWRDNLIKLHSENVRDKDNSSNWSSRFFIQISRDQGKIWDNFFNFDDLKTRFCDIAIIHNDKINCILINFSPYLNLLVFEKDGNYINNTINNSGITTAEIIAAYTKDNKLILVWSDQRARFPYPDIIDPARGPYLIMAGELNLDTLEFKEHIIGYDTETLQDLYGQDFGKDFRNNNDQR